MQKSLFRKNRDINSINLILSIISIPDLENQIKLFLNIFAKLIFIKENFLDNSQFSYLITFQNENKFVLCVLAVQCSRFYINKSQICSNR